MTPHPETQQAELLNSAGAHASKSGTARSGTFLILLGFVVVLIQAFVVEYFVPWPYVLGSMAVIVGVGLRLEAAVAKRG